MVSGAQTTLLSVEYREIYLLKIINYSHPEDLKEHMKIQEV